MFECVCVFADDRLILLKFCRIKYLQSSTIRDVTGRYGLKFRHFYEHSNSHRPAWKWGGMRRSAIITLCWPWVIRTDGLMGECSNRTKIETLIKDALSFNQSWTHGIVHYSDLIRNLSFSNFDLIIYCLSSCFSQSFPKLSQYKCVHQLFIYGICLISLICGVWRTNNPPICWCCEANGNPVIDGILYFTHMMFVIIMIINQINRMEWKCSGNRFPAIL